MVIKKAIKWIKCNSYKTYKKYALKSFETDIS